MGNRDQVEKEIREAYIFLRENNQTVPSDTLQFMLDASLEKLNNDTIEIENGIVVMVPKLPGSSSKGYITVDDIEEVSEEKQRINYERDLKHLFKLIDSESDSEAEMLDLSASICAYEKKHFMN